MSKTLIRNRVPFPITLPPPFMVVLGQGQGIIVPQSEAVVISHLGGSSNLSSFLEVKAVPDGNALSSVATSHGVPMVAQVRAQANVDLSAPGAAIDGVTMTEGMRFLADLQTTPAQDGLYVWNGAAKAATRAPELPVGSSASGAMFIVLEGTDAAALRMVSTAPGSDVVGTDGLTTGAVGSSLAMTESDLRTAAAALTADLAVNSQKITGLAAATVAGDATRFEQVVRTTGNQTGASAIAGDKDWTGAALFSGGVSVTTAPSYPIRGTVAALNALVGVAAGAMGYATDGRKGAEGAGAGTGTMVYVDSTLAWVRVEDGTAVAA